MVADDLVTQEARASAAGVLRKFKMCMIDDNLAMQGARASAATDFVLQEYSGFSTRRVNIWLEMSNQTKI